MPGYDRILDPLTGDYVDGEGGSYAETLTIAPAVFHQMKTKRGFWWGDFEAGSDLYLVKDVGADTAGKSFAENALLAAMQPFVDLALASDPQVEVEALANGRIVAEASLVDVQHGPVSVVAPIGEG